jgi:hypothetical protein
MVVNSTNPSRGGLVRELTRAETLALVERLREPLGWVFTPAAADEAARNIAMAVADGVACHATVLTNVVNSPIRAPYRVEGVDAWPTLLACQAAIIEARR